MRPPRHFYAFAHIDTASDTGVHVHFVGTAAALRYQLAFYKKNGVPVGPVVKVPVPKIRKEAK